jgi:hypothetical protein
MLSNPGRSAAPVDAGFIAPQSVGGCTLANGWDASCRPLRPSLFATDITLVDATGKITGINPTLTSGDWQNNRTSPGQPPFDVLGTWKAVNAVDPAKSASLGPDADAFLNNIVSGNEGYLAEVRWRVSDLKAALGLRTGHVYRFQFLVHDGDQNKSGGDVGQACAHVIVP